MNCKALYDLDYVFNEYCKLKNPKVDKKLYKKIFEDFGTQILKAIVDEGRDYYMPNGLGSLRIKKRMLMFKFKPSGDINLRSTGCGVDWGNTRKMWRDYPESKEQKKVLYYTNDHSNNWKYSFMWNKNVGKGNTNDKLFSLKVDRAMGKRYLAKVVKQGKQAEYYL